MENRIANQLANTASLDISTKIVLNYAQKDIAVLYCHRCGKIIGEHLIGRITIKCKHCGLKQEVITA